MSRGRRRATANAWSKTASPARRATVIEVVIPHLAEHLGATSLYVNRTRYDINTFLAARPHAPVRNLQQLLDGRRYHPKLDLLEACGFGPERPEYDPQYYGRLAAREEFARAVQHLMSQHGLDALIYPDVQVVPPTRAETDGGRWTTLSFPTNTLIASQTWLPAISVPAGFTADGLPVGLEFVARQYDEPTMLRLAYGFEQATRQRRPPAAATTGERI
jgi:amidase